MPKTDHFVANSIKTPQKNTKQNRDYFIMTAEKITN